MEAAVVGIGEVLEEGAAASVGADYPAGEAVMGAGGFGCVVEVGGGEGDVVGVGGGDGHLEVDAFLLGDLKVEVEEEMGFDGGDGGGVEGARGGGEAGGEGEGGVVVDEDGEGQGDG